MDTTDLAKRIREAAPRGRLEDERLVRGGGHFVADLRFERLVHGCVVRSPLPHGRVRGIDVSRARQARGVLGVISGKELMEAGVGPFPVQMPGTPGAGDPGTTPPMLPLAAERVRYVGEPIAFAVAETAHAARDAAEAVEADIEPLPHVATISQAVAADAPLVWEGAGSNVIAEYRLGDGEAWERIARRAWRVIEARIGNNRLVPSPLEPRACVGEYDEASARWTLHTATQAPHLFREILCDAVLGVPRERLRIVVPRIGGSFGSKLTPYPEDALVLYAARKFGRPVKWQGTRLDAFMADFHARDHQCEIALAFDEAMRIIGMRVLDYANMGAYASPFGIPIATATGNRIATGVYDIPVTDVTVRAVLTNTVPTGPYRGAGRPEVVHRLERAIGIAADELGIDPVELRRRNMIERERLPYRVPSGLVYDSGDFHGLLAAALRRSDWRGFAARRSASERNNRLRGRGIAMHIDSTSGLSPAEAVDVRLCSDGLVEICSGTQEMGQGLQHTYARIAAAQLGIDARRVVVVQGDTALVRSGTGSYGSRSLYVGGAAVVNGVARLIEALREEAARHLEVRLEDVDFAHGACRVAGTDRGLPMEALAERTEAGQLGVRGFAEAPFCFPNGCYVCEVEIDRETGVVAVDRMIALDDVGTVFDPVLVEGQIHGGLAQGIGQALIEAVVYDEASGQLLTGSFMDYAMPRADDVPAFVVSHDITCPARTNALGAKGAGESGAVGAPPAVVAAIVDALRPFGVRHIEMPVRSETIWRIIHRGGEAGA